MSSGLSRFENAVSSGELLRMSEALAEAVIQRHRLRKRKVRCITIDLDLSKVGPAAAASEVVIEVLMCAVEKSGLCTVGCCRLENAME